MTDMLTENGKMKETNKLNPVFHFVDWAIRAGITCPWADVCARICYALKNNYLWDNTIKAQEWRLELTFKPTFVEMMDAAVKLEKYKLQGRKTLVVRIHSSGDFGYKGEDRPEYFDKWVRIARMNYDVIFYAYTKCVKMVKDYLTKYTIPENLRIIYSLGGKQDDLIEESDPQAKIILKGEEIPEGWENAQGNDMVALLCNRIALPYH